MIGHDWATIGWPHLRQAAMADPGPGDAGIPRGRPDFGAIRYWMILARRDAGEWNEHELD
ncbi:hypothetical protein [Novosphingobium colocasiae]|uniref:hypothetical protein n=1 Tax=Novosphingobium colocasiae TaxID=1256513 RepID=UPI0016764996|nr:hypothetical protein [Novosphingobium colocasiae]